MEKLDQFRNQVQTYLRLAGLSQKSLAGEMGLHTNVLSRKLNALANSRLTTPEVKVIILALARWQAITNRTEALELLSLMNLPESIFSPADWGQSPLNSLDSSEVKEVLPALSRSARSFSTVLNPGSGSLPGHTRPVLPRPLTTLVGREWAVARVVKLLKEPGVNLLTLTGAGGIGKTRLALQVAREIQNYFNGRTFFVSLAALGDPELVLFEIARHLGIKPGEELSLAQELGRELGESPVLLVLDNFEHLLPAASKVGELLEAAQALKILATSREALKIYGEYQFGVPPLDLPDLHDLPALEKLPEYEAIRLFVERAKAVHSSFEMSEANAPVIAEICILLDGLPLAIELAAGRSQLLTPGAMLDRLKNPAGEESPEGARLKMLVGGPLNRPSRQQTLENALEWSFNLLSPAEQSLFSRLGVFAGGFNPAAVAGVCGMGEQSEKEILDRLGSLMDKSLLVPQPLPIPRQEKGGPRFMLLETLQEFALARLSRQGELAGLKQAHARFFLGLVELAGPDLINFQLKPWMEVFELENQNFRAALGRLIQPGAGREAREIGLRLAAGLWRFWFARGYFSEGRRWLNNVLSPAFLELEGENLTPALNQALAQAHYGAGMLAFYQGDYTRAEGEYQKSLNLYRAQADKSGVAQILSAMAQMARMKGDFPRMRALYREAIQLFEELNDGPGYTSNKLIFGIGLWQEGCYEEARAIMEESRVSSLKMNHSYGVAGVELGLGWLALSQGEIEEAASHFEKGLVTFKQFNQRYYAQSLLGQAFVLVRQGKTSKAKPLYQEGLAIQSKAELNDRWAFAWFLYGLAELAVVERQYREGVYCLAAAEKLLETLKVHRFAFLRESYDRSMQKLNQIFSEEELVQAWQAGRNLEPQSLVKLVLS